VDDSLRLTPLFLSLSLSLSLSKVDTYLRQTTLYGNTSPENRPFKIVAACPSREIRGIHDRELSTLERCLSRELSALEVSTLERCPTYRGICLRHREVFPLERYPP